MSDSGQGYNIWGVIAGVISTVAFVPILFCWYRRRLPRKRIDVLEKTLNETQALFRDALEEGLLGDQHSVHRFRSQLWRVKCSIDDVRAQVYGTTDFWEDVKNWREGVSGTIAAICKELQGIRAKIANRSSRERKLRGPDAYRGRKEHTIRTSSLDSNLRDPSIALVDAHAEEAPSPPPQRLRRGDTGAPSSDARRRSTASFDVDPKDPLGHTLGRRRLKAHAEKRRARRQLLLRLGRKLFGGPRSDAEAASTSRSSRFGGLLYIFSCTSRSRHNSVVTIDQDLYEILQGEEDEESEWKHATYWQEVELLA